MWFNFCFQDEVVKYSPHARAIRDVEDEELRSFFYGMSPWQVLKAPLILVCSVALDDLSILAVHIFHSIFQAKIDSSETWNV